jgi:hypothetical protein
MPLHLKFPKTVSVFIALRRDESLERGDWGTQGDNKGEALVIGMLKQSHYPSELSDMQKN